MNTWLAFKQRDSGKVSNRYVVRNCLFSSLVAVVLSAVTVAIGSKVHVPLLLFNQVRIVFCHVPSFKANSVLKDRALDVRQFRSFRGAVDVG
jgi:hypothetical protein